MIRVQTAITAEIDDIDDAVAEIKGQLDLESVGAHAAGIVFTYYDFIESGVLRAICGQLPFEVIGMTTMASASEGDASPYTLRLIVLSSDELVFRSALTAPLSEENYEEEIAAAYTAARAALPGDPAVILSFLPYLGCLSGADMVAAFDSACGGIPIWGSIASGMDMSFDGCRTILNGETETNGLAMLLIHGPIEPEFAVVSIPEKNIRENRGFVTDSTGCLLKTVNDLPILEYLGNLGIELRPEDATTVPFLVDYGDGSLPVALAVFAIHEDGSLLTGGPIPVGASFSLGEIDTEGILETARAGLGQILASRKKNGLLLLPCISRYIMLAPNQDAEIEAVLDGIGGAVPFMMGYSGGEVCPMKDADGRCQNRFHNYTFSAMVF
jgi:hypothetical protein